MSTCRMTFHFDSEPDLIDKMSRHLSKVGYRVERAVAPMVTIASLCAEVGRSSNSVSRSLHRASCPKFWALYGQGKIRRRIIKIERTPELLAFLKERKENYCPKV